jgi:hypothetical protein
MKWVFLILTLGAASMFLALEKGASTVLRAELEHAHLQRAELEALQRERSRLLALQPTSDDRFQLQSALALRAERQRAIETAEHERREAQRFVIGEWVPAMQWADCGQSTPRAAVQTMLWASAGGDTGRLASLLHLDEGTRAKLDQVFATLPAHARATYATAEQLLGAFTAKSIPPGDTQIVWQQQSDHDAVACFWIKNPAASPATEVPEKGASDSKAPPMLPPDPKRSQALLALRHFDHGWRIIVPGFAIDRLARELGASK